MTLEQAGPSEARTPHANGNASTPISTASTSSSRPGFSSRLMTTSEIAQDLSLLQHLKQLVNDAYKGAHYKLEDSLGVPRHSFFTGLRLRSDMQIVHELPPKDSLVALMFEDVSALQSSDNDTTHLSSDSSNSTNGRRDKLVAIASVKKWKGSVAQRHWRAVRAASSDGSIEKDIAARYDTALDTQVDPQLELYHEWEIATCASLDDAKYRGMGFISHLNALLLAHLQDRLFQDRLSRHDPDAVDEKPIRLWVSALGGTINKNYWIKRGYTVVKDADTIPPGVWGNVQDIQVWTLNKVVVT